MLMLLRRRHGAQAVYRGGTATRGNHQPSRRDIANGHLPLDVSYDKSARRSRRAGARECGRVQAKCTVALGGALERPPKIFFLEGARYATNDAHSPAFPLPPPIPLPLLPRPLPPLRGRESPAQSVARTRRENVTRGGKGIARKRYRQKGGFDSAHRGRRVETSMRTHGVPAGAPRGISSSSLLLGDGVWKLPCARTA